MQAHVRACTIAKTNAWKHVCASQTGMTTLKNVLDKKQNKKHTKKGVGGMGEATK